MISPRKLSEQMTKQQAEAIYRLTRLPEWEVYMQVQQDKLDKLHKDLEWEDKNIKTLQGQIVEIRQSMTLKDSADNALK